MDLREMMLRGARFTVLTGAGISVGSGIPAYRDDKGQWQGSQPIQHQDFVSKPASRQRYWARSVRGWPRIAAAQSNSTHTALAALERAGRVNLLVTQNVDRLHQLAGHRNVIDLHGRLDQVVCLQCGQKSGRNDLQSRLLQLNPGSDVSSEAGNAARPDGDADVSEAEVLGFQVPDCELCGGVLKPDVVFFGGTVPMERVQQARAAVESSDALIVIGSSLTVFSGFRFCRYAQAAGKPIFVINRGATRADEMSEEKITEDCAVYLNKLVACLNDPQQV